MRSLFQIGSCPVLFNYQYYSVLDKFALIVNHLRFH